MESTSFSVEELARLQRPCVYMKLGKSRNVVAPNLDRATRSFKEDVAGSVSERSELEQLPHWWLA